MISTTESHAEPAITFVQWPPPSMEVHADDAAELMRTLGWTSAHVLGISYGGMIVQQLLLRQPAVVRDAAVTVAVIVASTAAVGAEVHGHAAGTAAHPRSTCPHIAAAGAQGHHCVQQLWGQPSTRSRCGNRCAPAIINGAASTGGP